MANRANNHHLSRPWLTVRSDRCVRADGQVIDPFHVLEYRTWVCIVALTPTGEVILTREYRHGAGIVAVGLPGGSVEAYDESNEAAARRELLEETGYQCQALVEVGRCYANWSSHTNQIVFFVGHSARLTASKRPDPNEQIEVVLQDWNEYRRQSFMSVAQSFHLAAITFVDRVLA